VVVLNIGVNDLAAMPAEATFKTNYAYILDAIRTKYPSAPIVISKVWAIGEDADAATWATWVDTVLATRPWATVGCDESITLKAGDNGAARMFDALHPNTLGHQSLAAAYKTALGL
jgi:lysophospholipase L1-like esterase